MKNLCVMLIMIALPCQLSAGSDLVKNKADVKSCEYTFTAVDGGNVFRKTVYLVGAGNVIPERIVYIFHGYKPKGDPFRQSPAYFIRNWNLDERAAKHSVLFVIPDNEDSVYPVTQAERPGSDLWMLARLREKIATEFHAKKSPLVIGFSAGVEGAIKFSLMNDIHEIMAISGNYNLFDLPAGERAFHERVFGKGLGLLQKENPIDLLKGSGRTIYLFCEEKNAVNVRQAETLVSSSISGVSIIDFRALGKGFSHDWTFLTSRGILDQLDTIVSGGNTPPRIPGK